MYIYIQRGGGNPSSFRLDGPGRLPSGIPLLSPPVPPPPSPHPPSASLSATHPRYPSPLGLYKTFFYFKACVHESIILVLPPPTCNAHTIAILLHDHCAIKHPYPTRPLYAIHHTILAMAILCKGQLTMMICLPPQGTPPQHSSRHGPQRTQHTASTAATPRSPPPPSPPVSFSSCDPRGSRISAATRRRGTTRACSNSSRSRRRARPSLGRSTCTRSGSTARLAGTGGERITATTEKSTANKNRAPRSIPGGGRNTSASRYSQSKAVRVSSPAAGSSTSSSSSSPCTVGADSDEDESEE